ncbi:DNA replication complex GINS family protein [Candidatus Pacearchaeota archaeon]|nr:DNA replication complex GINS family protein [Candidatus Pacearchaeota archaeon]
MITYGDIYEALRKEKYSEPLQLLDKKFILDVAEYFVEKKEISNKKDDMFSDEVIKTKKQLENAVLIFKELMMRRTKKILSLAFIARETGISKRDFENMTSFEKETFEKIVKSLEENDKKMNETLNGKREEKSGMILVSFKENVEEFMNMDGGQIGPFERGEISNLPENIAKILIEAGKAELVEE